MQLTRNVNLFKNFFHLILILFSLTLVTPYCLGNTLLANNQNCDLKKYYSQNGAFINGKEEHGNGENGNEKNNNDNNDNDKDGNGKNGNGKNGNSKNGDSKKDENEPPNEGNLALPDSQQPGPLFSFGGNVFEKKGIWQLNLFGEYFKGPDKYATDIFPYLIYTLSDRTSIFVAAPIAVKFKDEPFQSSGIEDVFAQLEHAFYSKKTSCYTQQATIVLAIYYPTGNALLDIPTGYGSPAFFIGGTFNRMYNDWLFFTSHGALIGSSFNQTRMGNQYLYEGGIGRNIAYVSDRWIFDLIFEINGTYVEKNRILGEYDPDSGGNTILLTPSLWFSTQKLIFQFGVSKPIVQNLFGDQQKYEFALFGNFAYTF